MVEIIDLGGKVVASASFMASTPNSPTMGCIVIIPPAVRVAAGGAYFVDASGAIRRLDPAGKTTDITTLKLLTSRPLISFAVSPDGVQLMATVVNDAVEGGTLDLENATSGSPATIVFHRSLAQPGHGATLITGWDNGGPTASLESVTCVPNRPASSEFTGSALVHLAPDGTHLDQIGGRDCAPLDELADGTVLCTTAYQDSFTVRNQHGDVGWGDPEPVSEPRLSPDGTAVAVNFGTIDGNIPTVITPMGSRPSSGARLNMTRGTVLGWAGKDQLVVVRQDGHLGLLSAKGPVVFADLGLTLGQQCCAPDSVFLAGTIGVS